MHMYGCTSSRPAPTTRPAGSGEDADLPTLVKNAWTYFAAAVPEHESDQVGLGLGWTWLGSPVLLQAACQWHNGTEGMKQQSC